MFQVFKSVSPGFVEVGNYASKAEAEAAVYAIIDAELPGKAYVYAEDDADNPGCSDFFASAGAMSLILSINHKSNA